MEKGFQCCQAMVLCCGFTTTRVLKPCQEFVDDIVVDHVKAYVGKGYGLFLPQEFSEKIDRVTIGFNCILAVAFVFWKVDSQESPHMFKKAIITLHGSPPGSSAHIFPAFFP
jgi:hypothetical protein